MTSTAELLDLERFDEWVGDRLPGRGEPTTVERISLGASNEILRIARGDHPAVMLRRPPLHHHDPEQAGKIMVREFRLLQALNQTDVPHPEALLGCDDPAVIGAQFYVMAEVDGWTPMGTMPSPFADSATLRHAMGLDLVDSLADLALVDWREVGLEGFGKPEGFLDRQVDRWLSHLERVRFRDIPGLDDVATWLRSHVPPGQPPAIMHGDYQFANVMFAHDRPEVVAIIDFEQSTIGDPLLDLGWVTFGWGSQMSYVQPSDGLPSRDELVELYAARTGLDVTYLDYYEVLARFKLACVLEGSYARFVSGKSDKDAHRQMGQVVLDLVAGARAAVG